MRRLLVALTLPRHYMGMPDYADFAAMALHLGRAGHFGLYFYHRLYCSS